MKWTWKQKVGLAREWHAGQTDKQGAAYIEHLLAVASGVSERAKTVALFHDSVEDGRASWEQIAEVTTGEELAALRLLTHEGGTSYEEYIERIATAEGLSGELARETKQSDLRHNLGRLTASLERLRGRYEYALARLS